MNRIEHVSLSNSTHLPRTSQAPSFEASLSISSSNDRHTKYTRPQEASALSQTPLPGVLLL